MFGKRTARELLQHPFIRSTGKRQIIRHYLEKQVPASGQIRSLSSMMSIYGGRPTMGGAPKYGKYAREYFDIIDGVGGLNHSTSYFDGNNNNKYFEFGKTNYYGNYQFGRRYGTQSVYAATVDRVAGHMMQAAASDAGGGNKHVTLSPHSAITGAMGYSGIDTDDSYGLDAVLSEYAFKNLSRVELISTKVDWHYCYLMKTLVLESSKLVDVLNNSRIHITETTDTLRFGEHCKTVVMEKDGIFSVAVTGDSVDPKATRDTYY